MKLISLIDTLSFDFTTNTTCKNLSPATDHYSLIIIIILIPSLFCDNKWKTKGIVLLRQNWTRGYRAFSFVRSVPFVSVRRQAREILPRSRYHPVRGVAERQIRWYDLSAYENKNSYQTILFNVNETHLFQKSRQTIIFDSICFDWKSLLFCMTTQ